MKINEAVAYSCVEENDVAHDLNSENLQMTLPMSDLVGLFAKDLAEIVEFDSFEYEIPQQNIRIFRGMVSLHQCHYRLKESGLDLGEITLTRDTPFLEEEMLVVERALGALSIHLNNAIGLPDQETTARVHA